MTKSVRVLALIAVGLALFSAAGCNKLKARDQLNKGVQAYKNARYEEAIGHFQQAVSFDPTLINARLYLATAYAQQYIPGADTEDNNRLGQQAIDEYKSVLERDPKNINSIKGIAYLYLQMKKFEDSKTYYRKAITADPNDPEPYYSVAVIDWTQTYQPRMEERAKLGLKPDEPLNPKDKNQKKVCEDLKEKNSPIIQDGIDNLNKALQLRPDYDDAMAYMNLMYRERADVECDDLAARAADFKTADDWVDKTMATKKAKAEKQPGAQGITMDQGK
ncbi:MAG TPA: tetratricopeptide repeat protein [Terriglobales bacterium]|jgi:tetratricopeptide (TPR) repeat protein|nr:tetratricopeptide repeat protein [Terriglobales bacterium]